MLVRGVDLAYRDEGSGDVPLVWCHGFASSVRSEGDGLIDFRALAQEGRVVRSDARGHGQSQGGGHADEYRWECYGRDLVEIADGLELPTFIAGGLSMGAAVALHAAIVAPERVIGLVLVTPPAAYEARVDESRRYVDDAVLVETRGVDAFAARVNSTGPPDILAPVAGDFYWTPDVDACHLPSAMRGAAASDLPSQAELLGVSTPTLILTWAGDPGHPLETAEELHRLLPQSELKIATELSDVVRWTTDIADFRARQSSRDE